MTAVRAWFGLVIGLAVGACDAPAEDPRGAEIANVLVAADAPLLAARPALMAGKYRRMAESPFRFYRGAFPLYVHDMARGDGGRSSFWADVHPLSVGDAHPENFGALPGPRGAFAIEPDDFDAADRWDALLELRRLSVGLVLAAHASNPDDDDARAAAIDAGPAIARAAAAAYAGTLRGDAHAERPRDDDEEGAGAVLDDVLRRAARDLESRAELAELTRIGAEGERRLLRGAIDEEDPESILGELPAEVTAALPDALLRYRATLDAPPPPAFFALEDAARVYGTGISSFARVRILVLVAGPSADPADDVLLELKELADLYADPSAPAPVAADLAARNRAARELLWSQRPADPLWGTTELLGLPLQVRGEFAGYKGVRVKRLSEERGTPAALIELGAALGVRLAQMHLASEAGLPGTAAALRAAIGDDPDAFADEQAAFAVDYAARVESDWARFTDALDRLGPTLGYPASDAPPDGVRAALFAGPP